MRTVEAQRVAGCLVAVREESTSVGAEHTRYISIANEQSEVTIVRSRSAAIAIANALWALALNLPEDGFPVVLS